MTQKTFRYVKRATRRDKALMLEIIRNENEFEQQEPHGWDDENETEFSVEYKLYRAGDTWQANAFLPNGEMMDNSYHMLFCRCSEGHIFTLDCDDFIYCPDCQTEITDYQF